MVEPDEKRMGLGADVGVTYTARSGGFTRMSANPKPVTVVITATIRPDKVETAKRELEAVIKIVMANEPACHGIRVHDDPKNPRRLLIVEHWDSEEVFTGPHMQTPHMQKFLKTAEGFLDGEAEFGFWREIIVAT
jgi:quinol monooxygenase YgiN